MNKERREEGKISPEDATFRILSGCGIQMISLTDKQGIIKEEVKIDKLESVISTIRHQMNNIGTLFTYTNIVGVDHRNFKVMPTFTGTDKIRYSLCELYIESEELSLMTAMQRPFAPRVITQRMDPLDLLSRMPDAQ